MKFLFYIFVDFDSQSWDFASWLSPLFCNSAIVCRVDI